MMDEKIEEGQICNRATQMGTTEKIADAIGRILLFAVFICAFGYIYLNAVHFFIKTFPHGFGLFVIVTFVTMCMLFVMVGVGTYTLFFYRTHAMPEPVIEDDHDEDANPEDETDGGNVDEPERKIVPEDNLK